MKPKLKAYYAHPIALYHSAVAKKDVRTLRALNFQVVNPSDAKHKRLSIEGFIKLSRQADLIAFRSFGDGKVGSGVALEVGAAMRDGKPVVEMTPCLVDRVLSRNETRQRMCLPPLRHPETAPFGMLYDDEYADQEVGDQ